MSQPKKPAKKSTGPKKAVVTPTPQPSPKPAPKKKSKPVAGPAVIEPPAANVVRPSRITAPRKSTPTALEPAPRLPAKAKRPATPKAKAPEPVPSPVVSAAPEPVATAPEPEIEPILTPEIHAEEAVVAPAPATTPPPKPATPPLPPPFQPPVLPAFLYEMDQPAPAPLRGPGARYALVPHTTHFESQPPAPGLPESYGTGRLFLTARDPEWVHADWDFSPTQLRDGNKASPTGHLWLRIKRLSGKDAESVSEVALHRDSRHWFIHVGEPGCTCEASLGYPTPQGGWHEMARSKPATTPGRGIATGSRESFVTREVEPPSPTRTSEPSPAAPGAPPAETPQFGTKAPERIEPQQSATGTNHEPTAHPLPRRPEPLNEIDHLLDFWWREAVSEGHASLAGLLAAPGWSAAQAEALASLLRIDEEKRVWLGSLELTREMMERHAANPPEGPSSIDLAEMASAILADSSPPGGEDTGRPQRSFWFKVNAELVIYGSVASGGRVKIGSRPLHLRPDGTFSQRFILPDGTYSLPVEAESGDGAEKRVATMHFVRDSEYRGEVAPHPQDPALKLPKAENVESAP